MDNSESNDNFLHKFYEFDTTLCVLWSIIDFKALVLAVVLVNITFP